MQPMHMQSPSDAVTSDIVYNCLQLLIDFGVQGGSRKPVDRRYNSSVPVLSSRVPNRGCSRRADSLTHSG